MTILKVPQKFLDEMVGHAHELTPFECCGLLAGKGGVVTRLYRIKNIVATEGAESVSHFDEAKLDHLKRLTPEERAEIAFVMDAREQSQALKDMRTNGIELQAFYHSHPKDPARPSTTDIRNAVEFDQLREKLNLPAPCHFIISLMEPGKPDIRAYWITPDGVTPAQFSPA